LAEAATVRQQRRLRRLDTSLTGGFNTRKMTGGNKGWHLAKQVMVVETLSTKDITAILAVRMDILQQAFQ
jgi:hypothetical protein